MDESVEAPTTQRSTGRGGRILGKSLLTLASVITAVGPLTVPLSRV